MKNSLMRKVASALGSTIVLFTALINSNSWADPTTVAPAATALLPAAGQQYLVIGSFTRRENARQ